ncbi:MAG: hypothetical protein ACOZQL_36645 [Myxococcota bacterium]
MWCVALSLFLAQAPVAEPVKLASVGLNRVKVSKELAASFEETFALRLGQTGLVRVTTPRDVASIIGVERQRQLLGCADAASECLAELAGALGAEGIITGEIAQVGKLLQLTLKILSPKTGQPMFASIKRLKGEEEVLEEIDRVALEAAKQLHAQLRPPKPVVAPRPEPVEPPKPAEPVVVSSPAPTPRPSLAPWVLVGVGAAALVGGGVSQGLAAADFAALQQAAPGADNLRALRDGGELKQAIGLTALGVGGALVVGGVLWAALAPSSSETGATAWVAPGAGGVLVTGRF